MISRKSPVCLCADVMKPENTMKWQREQKKRQQKHTTKDNKCTRPTDINGRNDALASAHRQISKYMKRESRTMAIVAYLFANC